MSYADKNILTKATQEVFETMFFTFVEAKDPEVQDGTMEPEGCYVHAQIKLKSPQDWKEILHILMPKKMALALASVLLYSAHPHDISETEILDMVKEIVSIVLGKAFREAREAKTQLSATLSAQIINDIGEFQTGPGIESIHFQTDWGIMLLLFENGPTS